MNTKRETQGSGTQKTGTKRQTPKDIETDGRIDIKL